MLKKNKFVKALAGSAMLSFAGSALATEVTVPASTTVDNAIDLAFAGTLNFGTIRATVGGADGDCAGIVLPAQDGQAIVAATDTETGCTPVDAVLSAIDNAVERPEFTVSGLSPFTTVTLSDINDGNDARLRLTGASNTMPSFVLSDWTAYQSSGTAGGVTLGGTGNITSDGAGEIVFTVGATLKTPDDVATAGVTGAYQDAAYEGTFSVEVVY